MIRQGDLVPYDEVDEVLTTTSRYAVGLHTYTSTFEILSTEGSIISKIFVQNQIPSKYLLEQ